KAMSLEKKTIAVVGAGGLIGSRLVSMLLEDKANVLAVDFSKDRLSDLSRLDNKEGKLECMAADITSLKSIDQIFLTADKIFGGLDGAVNTAYPKNKNYGREFFQVTYEDFCENLALHLGGYFLFMQQCAKYATSHQKVFSL